MDELPGDFKRQSAGNTPSHEIVGSVRLHTANQLHVTSGNLLESFRHLRGFYGRIEQLQRDDGLILAEALRQWIVRTRIVDGDERRARTVRLQFDHLAKIEFARIFLLDDPCQRANRRCAEQGVQGHPAAERRLDARQHARRQQRMTAELEEIRLGVDMFEIQQRAPDRGDPFLDPMQRLALLGVRRAGGSQLQGPPIQRPVAFNRQ